MKNFTNYLVLVAALVLFGACNSCVLGFLVILITSFGFGEWLPLFYYWQFNLPVLSVALPIVGMILLTAIFLEVSGKREEGVKTDCSRADFESGSNWRRGKEDHRPVSPVVATHVRC